MKESVILKPKDIIPWEKAIEQVKVKLGDQLPHVWELYSYLYLVENPEIQQQGIHGKPHLARVWLGGRALGGLLAVNHGIIYDVEAVDLFAIEHDRHRQNDSYDLGHGIRAAKGMVKRLKNAVNPQTLNLAAQICFWHVFPQQLAPKSLRNSWEWKIAINSDALDRTRNGEPHDLGDLDIKYLSLPEALLLVDVSRELAARSNKLIKTGLNAFMAVAGVGLKMGLLQPNN